MTDRYKGCTVVFDHEIREDDAEHLLNAIRMIKGVKAVEPHILDRHGMMRMDAVYDMKRKLHEMANTFELPS